MELPKSRYPGTVRVGSGFDVADNEIVNG